MGRETHVWREPGEALVFDDSFEHDVSNPAASSRVVLAVQLHHPGIDHDAAVLAPDGKTWQYMPPAVRGPYDL